MGETCITDVLNK